jgi:hypothetical protein
VAEVVEGMQAAAQADGGGAAAALRPGMFLHALDGESARTFGRRALRERLGRRYLQAHPYIQWPATSCARCGAWWLWSRAHRAPTSVWIGTGMCRWRPCLFRSDRAERALAAARRPLTLSFGWRRPGSDAGGYGVGGAGRLRFDGGGRGGG